MFSYDGMDLGLPTHQMAQISAPKVHENWISTAKTCMVAYSSSEITLPFVAVVEAVLAELENRTQSQNLNYPFQD
jgi:hypothetical protein